jgi:hypothetical protein
MQVRLTSDVEGKKSGDTATVTAERGAWLIAQGYAVAEGDAPDVQIDYSIDPTLASNREAPGADLPKVDRADNASEVNPEVAAFPADVDLSPPRGDEDKLEAPEVAYELGERRPALNTPLPIESDPEPTATGTDWRPGDEVPDTTNEWSEPDIAPPAPGTGTELPTVLSRAEAGSHEPGNALVPEEPSR